MAGTGLPLPIPIPVGVTVTVPTGYAPPRVQAELTLVGGGSSGIVVIPITDPAHQIKNLEGDWEQLTRPGRKPINARAGSKLAEVDLSLTIVAPDGGPHDPGNTVEPILTKLAQIAAADSDSQPIALTWGTFVTSAWVTTTGFWHITTLEIDPQLLQPTTNNISRAEVSLTLTEHSPSPTANPASVAPGWTKPPAPPKPVATSAAGGKITTWTVAASDTAYSIATAVYGSPEPGWRTILDANQITPSGLTGGLVIVIPQTSNG